MMIDDVKNASKIIKDGGIVLFPTETVYGIGANAFDDDAVKKIFIAKGRAQDNPLILHISDMDMLNDIAEDITDCWRDMPDTGCAARVAAPLGRCRACFCGAAAHALELLHQRAHDDLRLLGYRHAHHDRSVLLVAQW